MSRVPAAPAPSPCPHMRTGTDLRGNTGRGAWELEGAPLVKAQDQPHTTKCPRPLSWRPSKVLPKLTCTWNLRMILGGNQVFADVMS